MIPDRWQIVLVQTEDSKIYKVFGTWGGSYLHGQSWRMNSGIVKVTEDDKCYYFHGYSGSVYECYKNSYGSFLYGDSILAQMIDDFKPYGTITVLPENTDWMKLEYEM